MKEQEPSFTYKQHNLFLLLAGVFITNALLAEIIGAKIFSFEKTIGTAPANIVLFDYTLNFDLTAGVVLWPVVFIFTDVINEYYGKAGVQKVSFFTSILILYAFFMMWIVSILPPADFWVQINSDLDINKAFSQIFSQSMGIIVGSLTAFLIGQLVDVSAFQWLRRLSGSQNIWLRATGSTLISQLIDSFVVLFIAFYIFGFPKPWAISQVISVGIINYIYKFCIAIASTPLLYFVHYLIRDYLGKELSEKITKEASESSFF